MVNQADGERFVSLAQMSDAASSQAFPRFFSTHMLRSSDIRFVINRSNQHRTEWVGIIFAPTFKTLNQ